MGVLFPLDLPMLAAAQTYRSLLVDVCDGYHKGRGYGKTVGFLERFLGLK